MSMAGQQGIPGIDIRRCDDRVEIHVLGDDRAPGRARRFSVAETWNICQELGAAARQAQQHAAREQAEQAGVKTSAAPKIGRKPED
jgi:hypothetical protein